MSVRVIIGDALTELRKLPDESANMCCSSPPYWGLRDYGTAKWEGGDDGCDHQGQLGGTKSSTLDQWNNGLNAETIAKKVNGYGRASYGAACGKCGAVRVDPQLGLERTLDEYLVKMVAVFREVRRVLRKDGTLWLNMGDCYHSGDCGGHRNDAQRWQKSTLQSNNRGNAETIRPNRLPQHGLKDKDLVGVPWELAFALRRDGWWLRQDIIWQKPNPMPESAKDRCTKAHEYIFLLSKSARYYFDQDAIKEPASDDTHARYGRAHAAHQPPGQHEHGGVVGPRANTNGHKVPRGWDTSTGDGKNHRGKIGRYANETIELGIGRNGRPRKGVPNRRPKAWDVDMGSHRTLIAGHPHKSNGVGFGHGYDEHPKPRVKNNASFDAAMAVMPEKANKRSVWTVPTHSFKGAHFATFPPDLIVPCILAGCPVGGTVLDPFAGAGTTGQLLPTASKSRELYSEDVW